MTATFAVCTIAVLAVSLIVGCSADPNSSDGASDGAVSTDSGGDIEDGFVEGASADGTAYCWGPPYRGALGGGTIAPDNFAERGPEPIACQN